MGIKLVGVRLNEDGQITDFLTDDDERITFSEAKKLAQEGKIDSLTDVFENGTWVIDEYGQHIEGRNLIDLPRFW